ncbi:uncharacterized protein LOC131183340 [Hevea brasiliensis]|uniref:uncharacterized protein LOC131183340 n=1 Tax=Hevea brasiliensis TaxID=3981 RepID=UPI0025D1AF07|nr:uncharacterized protein LOC131183340 [Hevea brasiliensis]
MDILNVLDLSSTGIRELPMEISKLNSLQYLNLSKTLIRQLPVELKMLVNLKYLNLENNIDINMIPRGVISSLSSLQVLEMYNIANTKNLGFIYIVGRSDIGELDVDVVMEEMETHDDADEIENEQTEEPKIEEPEDLSLEHSHVEEHILEQEVEKNAQAKLEEEKLQNKEDHSMKTSTKIE